MDNRQVVIEVNIEHPDSPDRIQAVTMIPANEFGPDVIRHMCEALYGEIKEQARRRASPIIMPPRQGLRLQ